MTKRGLFITFEGIDGCGKSTQVRILDGYISRLSKYNHILKTREPYADENIRKKLREESDPYSHARQLAEMFIADRHKHIDFMINPDLEKGIHVISDRYDCSTLAYQQAQGLSFEELLKMHGPIIAPDLTFIVDVPVEVALERMKKDKDRKEQEQKFESNIEFNRKLRQCYLDLPKKMPYRKIILINAVSSPEEIFEKQIKPAFDNLWVNY